MSTQDENFPLMRWKRNGDDPMILQMGRRKSVDRQPYGEDLYIIWQDVPIVYAGAPDEDLIGGKTGKPQTVGH